jgi:hypothetical protein
MEATAEALRPDVGRQAALRWVRRRVTAVTVTLVAVLGLRPDVFAGRQPSLEDYRNVLGVEHVLPALREMASRQMAALPPPVGFGPRATHPVPRDRRNQQKAGADPPGSQA